MLVEIVLSVFTICAVLILYVQCVRLEFKERSPFIFLWIFLGAIYVFPSILDVINGSFVVRYRSVVLSLGRWEILQSQVYFCMIAALYLLFNVVVRPKELAARVIPMEQARDRSDELSWMLYVGIAFTFICAGKLYQQYGVAALELTFMDFQEEIPYWIMFGLQAFPKFYVGFLLWFMLMNRWSTAAWLTLLMAAVFFAFGGSRQNLVQIGLVVLLYLLHYTKVTTSKKLFIVAGGFVVFAVLFPVLLVLRDISSFEDRINFLMHDLPTVFQGGKEGGEFMLRGVYYHFISVFDNIPEFGKFNYFIRTLMFWIPTAYSGGLKPGDFEYTMFAAFTGDNATMHPTMPGSMYADSGWFAVPWVALLVGIRWLVHKSLFISRGAGFAAGYVCYCAAAVLIARGALYAGILICIMMMGPIFFTRFLRAKGEAVNEIPDKSNIGGQA